MPSPPCWIPLRACVDAGGDMRACLHALVPTFQPPEVVNGRVQAPSQCGAGGDRRRRCPVTLHERMMREALREAALAAAEGRDTRGRGGRARGKHCFAGAQHPRAHL